AEAQASSYINNSTSLQSNANFNISGTGEMATLAVDADASVSGTTLLYGPTNAYSTVNIWGTTNLFGFANIHDSATISGNANILGYVATHGFQFYGNTNFLVAYPSGNLS